MFDTKWILVGFIFFSLSCSGGKKANLPPIDKNKPGPAKKIVIAEKQEEAITKDIRLSGQVAYLNKTVLSFQADGLIAKVNAKPGMFFKKGQILAELDTRDLELALQMKKFQLDQALNKRELAKRDYDIEKQLRENDINSMMQLENSKSLYENTNLEFNIAQTNLKIAEKKLSDAKLKAPYDCIVLRQIKYVGQLTTGVSDSNGVIEINEMGDPEIHLYAPESLLSKVKIGTPLKIFVSALKIELAAKIIRFVPVISESSRQFLIIARLNKPDERVAPGYFVEGVIFYDFI